MGRKGRNKLIFSGYTFLELCTDWSNSDLSTKLLRCIFTFLYQRIICLPQEGEANKQKDKLYKTTFPIHPLGSLAYVTKTQFLDSYGSCRWAHSECNPFRYATQCDRQNDLWNRKYSQAERKSKEEECGVLFTKVFYYPSLQQAVSVLWN